MSKNHHGKDMCVVIERYTPLEGKLQEVVEMTTEVGKMLHGYPGLIQVQVLKPSAKGDVISTATWESEVAFKKFIKSQTVKDLMKSDVGVKMKALTTRSGFETFNLVDGWHPSIPT